MSQLLLGLLPPPTGSTTFLDDLAQFRDFGRRSVLRSTSSCTFGGDAVDTPTVVNEFWTAKQRAAHSLHEVPYRACFKPQLPRFFIERFTNPGDTVYDPFMGRGTTVIEAALLGRVPVGCDLNPLSVMLARPRMRPPAVQEVTKRLEEIDLDSSVPCPEDLLTFYHPQTLSEICALRLYLLEREASGTRDGVDDWMRMVACSRLTGHSPGFFSVYTLPPNQAVSVERQRVINEKRKQDPPRRNVAALIAEKTRALLSRTHDGETEDLLNAARNAELMTGDAADTPQIRSDSVDLVVTSPPFLDVVNYAQDNWLRCWFCGIDPDALSIPTSRRVDQWQTAMTDVFRELARVLRPGGHVAFEVGEVRGGKVKLEEAVVPCGLEAGLNPLVILINDQEFTKTSNCWGVHNRTKGTNTNRIVVFSKD